MGMRRRDDAEGETMMLGFGREEDSEIRLGIGAVLVDEVCCFVPDFVVPPRPRLLPRNDSAIFRT